jgi:hypothetical protein
MFIAVWRRKSPSTVKSAQHFLIGEVLHAAGVIDAQLVCNLDGRGSADTVNIGERDNNALICGDVYPGNTSHLLLHAPQGQSGYAAIPYLIATTLYVRHRMN